MRNGRNIEPQPHSVPGAPIAPNLLQQDFHAQTPNDKWTTDTRYIWTQEARGW